MGTTHINKTHTPKGLWVKLCLMNLTYLTILVRHNLAMFVKYNLTILVKHNLTAFVKHNLTMFVKHNLTIIVKHGLTIFLSSLIRVYFLTALVVYKTYFKGHYIRKQRPRTHILCVKLLHLYAKF